MGRKMGREGGEIGAGQGFDRKKMPKEKGEGVGREGEWGLGRVGMGSGWEWGGIGKWG